MIDVQCEDLTPAVIDAVRAGNAPAAKPAAQVLDAPTVEPPATVEPAEPAMAERLQKQMSRPVVKPSTSTTPKQPPARVATPATEDADAEPPKRPAPTPGRKCLIWVEQSGKELTIKEAAALAEKPDSAFHNKMYMARKANQREFVLAGKVWRIIGDGD